ncbi:SusC/RagA family TonB-linked outer membrane protein [Chitinophaga deserti]|uniref:SusC/RagA family TonB-linked outer membrane protein n=1 Tax=Chitinophaga deserti TaxID=2164099 RepID=UPI000D6D748B|nr:TonB-dependent receptor [Chitinophaga deserti]
MKRIALFIFILSLCSAQLMAQSGKVLKGTVVNANNEPVVNATVQEKDTQNGTVTDLTGKFELRLKSNSGILLVSHMSYLANQVKVPSGDVLNIRLERRSIDINEAVVVGYGRQSKKSMTSSVSSVKGTELSKSSSPTLGNALTGRLSGVTSLQTSGQPGADLGNIYVRGQGSFNGNNRPMIIMDDIEVGYDVLGTMDVNEVETISVLKDAASTSVYGIKGANGVILITTKRGKTGPAKVNFLTEHGMQMPTALPKFLNSYESALLRREAWMNEGKDPVVQEPGFLSDAALEGYRTGSDPYLYPDVNWYEEVLKKSSYQNRNKIDISGGTERVKYFTSFGYDYQNGIFKDFSKSQGYNANYYLKRYSFRSNLDMNVTKTTLIKVSASGNFNEVNSPNGTSDLYSAISAFQNLPPYAYPIYNKNGTLGAGGSTLFRNPVGLLTYMGYNRDYTNKIYTNMSINQQLDFITPGLSARFLLGYNNDNKHTRSLTRGNFPSYRYDVVNDLYEPRDQGVTKLDPPSRGGTLGLVNHDFTNILQVDYVRNIKKHGFTLMGLLNSASHHRGSNSAGADEKVIYAERGFTGKVTYNYDRKYLLELSGAYNGSDRFKGSQRYAWFPAASAGWNISDEPFFKNNIKAISSLKLRGSIGLTGTDDVGTNSYVYEQVYQSNGTVYFGEVSTSFPGIIEGTLGNDNVTWEKDRKWNIGLDAAMFEGRLGVTLEYFDRFRYDILTTRSVPTIVGVGLPPVNLGKVQTRGLELELNFNDRKGDWGYGITGVFSFQKGKVVERDEPEPRYPHLRRTGRPIDQPFGYIWDGFYQNQRDIDTSANPAGTLIPGALKFKDINGDGKIDNNDQVPIGYSRVPQIQYGFTLSLSWKQFDMSILLQGAALYSVKFEGQASAPFQSNLLPIHQERWVPGKGNDAKFYSLAATTAQSNGSMSTFWLRRGDYLRIKNVELAYRLPRSVAQLVRLEGARIYANTYNLFTWSKMSDLYAQWDPERPDGNANYPIQRIINAGIQINF